MLYNYSQLDPTRYDVGQLLSYKRPISMVVGDRRIGKTFKITLFAIKHSLKAHKLSFIWLRIAKKEIDECKPKFFDDIAKLNVFPDYTFKVEGKFGIAINNVTHDKFPICYFDFVKNAQTIKGIPFPDVDYVILDEFMQEEGTQKCKNIISLFWSILYSVFALRKIKGILIGNAVTILNEFFTYYDIKDISRPFTKGSDYVIENTNYEDRYKEFRKNAKDSTFGKLVKGSDYEKYALDNKFMLDDTTGVDSSIKPKTDSIAVIKFESGMIGVYDEGEYLLFKITKSHDRLVVTPFTNFAKNDIIYVRYSDKFYKTLFTLSTTKKCFYDSLITKNEVVEFRKKVLGSIN